MTQLSTTLDVDCYRWMDWFHGGLQFQVCCVCGRCLWRKDIASYVLVEQQCVTLPAARFIVLMRS